MGLPLFSRPSAPQVQAPPPSQPEPEMVEDEAEARRRRGRRFALAGIQTGPQGAIVAQGQVRRPTLLGARQGG